MCCRLGKIALCVALLSVAAPTLAVSSTCLVGESIIVGEGWAARLSANGEVVAYHCENSICLTDYSTMPPTEERIDPPDLASQRAHHHDLSADGQRVVYLGPDGITLYDRATKQTSVLISDHYDGHPKISGNGLYVAFRAYDELIAADSNGYKDVVRYTISTGALELVSVSSTGVQGNEQSGTTYQGDQGFDISADGNVVVFESVASNLVPSDDNDYRDVFLRDIVAGSTQRVGLSTSGQELYYGATFPRISGDGNIITFSSYNHNYYAEPHLFAYDRDSGSVSRVAPTIDGNDHDYPTMTGGGLSLSYDGRFVYFESLLDNLVPGVPERVTLKDPNAQDAFVYDRESGTTRNLSYTSVPPAECTPVYRSMASESSPAEDKVLYTVFDGEWGSGSPPIIVLSTLPDMNPPRVNFASSPSEPTALSQIQLLGGQQDDVAPSDLAEYRIDGGDWLPFPLSKHDSQYIALYEDQFAASSLGLVGNHQICMRAYDARGNVGSTCKDLEILPESPVADSIVVQCLHEPVWPQPGETVTVTATAFPFDPADGVTLVDHRTGSDGSDRQEIVDFLEIWVNDNSQPAFVSPGSASSISYSFTATGTEFSSHYTSYGCRIGKGSEVAFSGWKLFGIGDYPHSRAIPIQKSTFPERAVDIVFVADEDDYTSASDPDFLDGVYRLLKYGYWNHTDFLKDQHRYNIWLARDMGNAKRGTFFNDEQCAHKLPGSLSPSGFHIEDTWVRYYQFADTAAIVHTEEFRDCAPGGRNIFSVDFEKAKVPFGDSDINTVRHETGHRPFGLADEYSPDGGYYQKDQFPNVYEEREDCEADVAALGRVPSDCREFIENDLFSTDWYISEPEQDDLMLDGQDMNANDKRRIDWMYRKCEKGDC